MKTKYLVILPVLAILAIAATVVTPGKKVSEYPNIAVPDDLDMFLMARTNIAVPTNANHQYGQLFGRVTNAVNSISLVTSNGLITEIITASNSLFTATTIVGKTNFLNLSVQAAKLPATNYPAIDAGWTAWETVYSETNAEGSRVNLAAVWQFIVPHDYATNSMNLLVNYSLLNTNGPNPSNVIWGASFLVVRSGTTNNVHTNAFGFVAWGMNDWIDKYDGTNIVTNLVINLGTNSALQAGDLSVMKLQRDALTDTYGGAVALHGLQLQYTRQ